MIVSGDGCYSFTGRQGGPQEISLHSSLCMSVGVIIHELMHSLGFIHEHSRSDRDKFVEIVWDNIQKEEFPNFEKYSDTEEDHFGEPYDFQSIMHYEFNAFAISGELPTIRPLDASIPLSYLGRSKIFGNLTKTDANKINKYYECQHI